MRGSRECGFRIQMGESGQGVVGISTVVKPRGEVKRNENL